MVLKRRQGNENVHELVPKNTKIHGGRYKNTMNSKRPELKPEEKKELFLICLAIKDGNITEACRWVGVHRKTYYYWIEEDEEFAAQVNDLEGETVDGMLKALSTLALGAKTHDKEGDVYDTLPNLAAIKFFLTHKAKKDGFGKDSPQGLPAGGGVHLHLHNTPEPKNLAEWEQQVREARKLRLEEKKKEEENDSDAV
jgi:hypothetical protein